MKIRYLASIDMYEIDENRISPVDLMRLINFNNFSQEEKDDMRYRGIDVKGDLDDDTFNNIVGAQKYYHISSRVLLLARRAAHLRRLGRTNSKWVELRPRVLHSKGGRPFGAKSVLSVADRERIETNLANQSVLISKFISRDWYNEFCEFHKELRRIGKCKLDNAGIKWKWNSLRYKWKLENGFTSKNVDYEKKLLEKSLKYDL